jgi:hypothetical protein
MATLGIAYSTPSSDFANLNDIQVVETWPAQMENSGKIPSVISYSPASRGELQWGSSISENAVTMVNTKLELDVQENKLDELDLILSTLDRVHDFDIEAVKKERGDPEYSPKTPEKIVIDYLTKVFEHLSVEFDDKYGSHLKSQLEVDVVVTVPVVC